MTPLFVIEKLHNRHNVQNFDCGVDELNGRLRDYATDPRFRSSGARVAVDDQSTVIGFYELVSNRIGRKKAPAGLLSVAPKFDIPTTHLASFAVAEVCQGQGIGRDLLLCAFSDALNAARNVDSYAIDLYAYDESARAFYVKCGFQHLGPRPNDLYILMKDVRTSLAV